MYPFHSSVTSQTHMPQLHPPHPASLPPNHVKNNRSRNSLLRHDTGEEKKKESYYDEGLVMNNICAIPKLKSHHFVPKGIYITVYNNTVKTFK